MTKPDPKMNDMAEDTRAGANLKPVNTAGVEGKGNKLKSDQQSTMAEGELDKLLDNFDKRCPKCLGEGHGGDGCEYCWNNNPEKDAIDAAKATINAYTTNKIIEARGGLDKPSDTASVGGNQVDTSVELAITELLQRLYNKVRLVQDRHTGMEFNAVHHKDIDYEYWKLTGRTLQ